MGLEFITEPEKDLAYPCFFIYGRPKVGKSGASVTGPGPVVYLNGDLPNALRFPRRRAGKGKIHEVDQSKGVLKAWTDLELAVQQQPEKIGTVVIDPVSELYRLAVREVSKGAVSPSLPTYQAAGFYLERLCRAVAVAPVVSVIIAHEFPVRDEATETVELLPYTGSNNPALGQRLMGMTDVIAYAGTVEQDGGRKYLSTLVDARSRRGGDRWGALGDVQPSDVGLWVDLVRASEQDQQGDKNTTDKQEKAS